MRLQNFAGQPRGQCCLGPMADPVQHSQQNAAGERPDYRQVAAVALSGTRASGHAPVDGRQYQGFHFLIVTVVPLVPSETI